MVVSCETFKSLELNLKVYPSLLGGRGGWRSKINQELIYFPLKKKKTVFFVNKNRELTF